MASIDPDLVDKIRGGIALTIKDAVKFSSDDYSPPKITPPAAFPGPYDIEPLDTDGGQQITFKWWIAVAATHKSKQRELDQAIRKATKAIDDQPGLGIAGAGVSAVVNSVGDYGDLEVAGGTYWGAMLTIEVLA